MAAPRRPAPPHAGPDDLSDERPSRFRLVIASDVCFYREALESVLAGHTGFDVVDLADDASHAVESVRLLEPDVVLLEVAMPGSEACVRDIRRASARTRVVALSVPEREEDIIRCAELGVDGYVFRSCSLEGLIDVIRAALKGELELSPKQTAELVHHIAELAPDCEQPLPRDVHFTCREAEVVRLIDQGLSNKEISDELNIRLSTVKNHVHNVLEKLHVHRRAEVPALLRNNSALRATWMTGPANSTRRFE